MKTIQVVTGAFIATALMLSGEAMAQAAGDSCSAGDLSGPDALGNNLICSDGVYVVAGGVWSA